MSHRDFPILPVFFRHPSILINRVAPRFEAPEDELDGAVEPASMNYVCFQGYDWNILKHELHWDLTLIHFNWLDEPIETWMRFAHCTIFLRGDMVEASWSSENQCSNGRPKPVKMTGSWLRTTFEAVSTRLLPLLLLVLKIASLQGSKSASL